MAGLPGPARGIPTFSPYPRLVIRLDFAADHRVGHGTIDLLERVAAEGSISRAAQSLRMSYPRALALLGQIDATLGEPATIRAAGGARGGGASVTPARAALVQRYRAIEAAAQRFADTL